MQIVKKGLKKERLAFHYGFDSSGDAAQETTRLDLLKAQRKQNEQHDTKAKAIQLRSIRNYLQGTIFEGCGSLSFLLSGRIRRCHICR